MSRTTANLLLLCAGAIWGMGFVAQQTAMDDIGPLGSGLNWEKVFALGKRFKD